MAQAQHLQRMLILATVTVVVCACLFASPCGAEFPTLQHPAKPDGSLAVMVIGDWGRQGEYNQTFVAAQMGIVGEEQDVDFIVSTGDNFYHDGLSGVDDPLFEQSFTDIYTAKSLQKKQWYAVLGNHDYHTDVLAQLDPALREVDRRWLCMRSFVLDAEVAHFFFLDTTPFELKYWTEPGKHTYDWRQVTPRDQYISRQLKELDTALSESTARWKFVVGHHTVRSVGNHGDTQELVDLLLPILKANDVDLYINGHDHCLEHISSKDSPIQFLTSGGGSKAWKGIFRPDIAVDKLQFYYDGQGFMTLKTTKDEVDIKFFDMFGNVLHKWRLTKEMHAYA